MKRIALFSSMIFFGFYQLYSQCGPFLTVGTAMYEGDCIEMTQATLSQAGCAWQPEKFDFSEPIDVEIIANFGDMNGGADGICMVFQLDPDGLNACGPHGGQIAAGEIENSLIIEFDTWQNADLGDPILDHIAVNINGDMGNSISPIVELGDIEDGLDHNLRFTWDPATMNYEVYFDNVLEITGTFDIPLNCFGGETEAYYGFTSSTGGAVNNHVICPVEEYVNEFLQAEICKGDSIMILDSIYTDAGQYTQMKLSEEGCDTIVFILIEVLETSTTNAGFAICDGDSVQVNGVSYSDEGSYVQFFTASNGCDSILNINLVVFPSYETEESYTISYGESIEINGETYSSSGYYLQELSSVFGCDSTVNIEIKLESNIVYQSLDSCIAVTGVSNMDYDEFTPEYPQELDCGLVHSSNIYRDMPNEYKHSCTPGLDGDPTMCVSSLDACEFDPNSPYAVQLDITLSPDPDSEVSLSGLSFYENAPENFNWINGNSGLNNYPTKYGIAVFKDGDLIFETFDVATTNTFDLQEYAFTGPEFSSSEEVTFKIIFLGYCLVGNGSPVAAWDLDEINVSATCDPLPGISGNISGKVTAFNGEEIPNVEVSLMKLGNDPKLIKDFSDEKGNYSFKDNPGYFDYQLSLFKNDQKMEGVTTLDLLYIQKHILGLKSFETAEQYIAADINGSNTITGTDIVLLRKLILGINAEFPANRSWQFLDASKQIDLDNIWEFKDVIEISSLMNNMDDMDFKAIKMGDVNSSYTSYSTKAESRKNNKEFTWRLGKAVSQKNTLYMPVFSEQITDLKGLDLTLELAGIDIVGIASGQMNFSAEHYIILDDKLHISWDYLEGLNIDPQKALFYLVTDRNKTSDYSQIIKALNHGTVYTGDKLEIHSIIWETEMEIIPVFESIQLGQNMPNPYIYKTQVPVFTEKAGNFELEILDLNGLSFYKEQIRLPAGKTLIEIDGQKFGIPVGIHTLCLKGPNEIKFVKMIRLD